MRRRRSLVKLLAVLVCTCVLATLIVVSFGSPQGAQSEKEKDVVDISMVKEAEERQGGEIM